MITVKATNNGRVKVMADKTSMKAFIDAMKDIAEDEEIEEDDDEFTYVDEPEMTETQHLITVAYNDEDDVVSVTYDVPKHDYSLGAALLEALSLAWPNNGKADAKFKADLHSLAYDARRNTFDNDVETDNGD